jgi:hypothetical protein
VNVHRGLDKILPLLFPAFSSAFFSPPRPRLSCSSADYGSKSPFTTSCVKTPKRRSGRRLLLPVPLSLPFRPPAALLLAASPWLCPHANNSAYEKSLVFLHRGSVGDTRIHEVKCVAGFLTAKVYVVPSCRRVPMGPEIIPVT